MIADGALFLAPYIAKARNLKATDAELDQVREAFHILRHNGNFTKDGRIKVRTCSFAAVRTYLQVSR